MDDRLHRLKRLTSALATRKRAYELRMAQINNRIATLNAEQDRGHAGGRQSARAITRRQYATICGGWIQSSRVRWLRRSTICSSCRCCICAAGADLRRSEIISVREEAEAERLRQNRYLEQVIDVSLQRRGLNGRAAASLPQALRGRLAVWVYG